MKMSLPVLLAAVSMALAPTHAFAERGRDRHCPPGLADRHPACIPWGQVRRELERSTRDDDDAEAALAIVGSLIGLALLDRASRERDDDEAREVAAAPVPWSPPEIPARPDSFAFLNEPEQPPAEAPDAAIPPAAAEAVAEAPVVGAGNPEPSLIPPAPPLADDVAPTSEDLAEAFERAQQHGDTGF